jgi:hypothetical protein
MRIRYCVYLIITAMINLLCWYYIIIFCAVYAFSANGWLYSVIQGLIIDLLVFELIQPVGILLFRFLAQKFPPLR